MAGSQLKRLKASLHDQGIIGPQKSKKQKKQAAEEARAAAASGGGNGNTKRLKRSEALDTIREQFNPFQFKMNARGPKFPVTSLKSASQPEGALRGIKGRPQAALSRSEEKRRSTLLIDMQRRNKVGGILDRRLGEGDPNMTPEERALERFAFEKQRIHNKKGAIFDLEGGEDEFLAGPGDGGLTHAGKSLAFGGDSDDENENHNVSRGMLDDFDERDVSGDDDDDDGEIGHKKQLKRLRSELGLTEDLTLAALEPSAGEDGAPERKKSKKEVMEEVIAKSKYHKYERQITKEADDDVRAALDNMLPELTQLLASGTSRSKDAAKDAPTTKLGGAFAKEAFDKAAFEKTYDVRLRQLIQDKKAEPSQRTKTEEEVAAEQSEHLKKLEESRVRRMMGQISYEDAEAEANEKEKEEKEAKKKEEAEAKLAAGPALQFIPADGAEEDEFGLGQGIKTRHTAAELGFDDEDDFLIDDDLVASGSEVEPDSDEDDEDDSDDEDGSDAENDEDEDDEFIRGLLTEDEKKNAVFANAGKLPATANKGSDDAGVPYTFICPQTHTELLQITEDIDIAKLPVVVQRIRALYHPKLDHGNKDRLGRFAAVLVEHIAYLAQQEQPPFAAIESVVRHIHSLAKTVPVEVAVAFRSHLADMEGVVVTHTPGEKGVLSLEAKTKGLSRSVAFNTGDLIVLTAIAAIFPTSDHFHQVVTPAMLAMGRYLEQSTPRNLADYATGLYVCTLTCQYQQLSKRYVPEMVNYVLNTLIALSPGESANVPADKKSALFGGRFPIHSTARGVRIEKATKHKDAVRKLRLSDCISPGEPLAPKAATQLKLALFSTALKLVAEMTTMWSTSSPAVSSSVSGTVAAADSTEDASKTKTVKGNGAASLYETLDPIRAVLTLLKTKACRSELPTGSASEIDRVAVQVDAAQRFAQLARRPLELHHHRPMAIRTFVPRFEAEFDPDKHYDPNRERADAAKLKAEFKRERKGALRELRKDAHFMQREKLKIKKAKDAAYEKKYKRLVAEIQGTEGREANAYERERAARKRR